VSRSLDRARQELGAARALVDAGFPTQAIAHACAAGLHTAQAALAELGELPPAPVAIASAYGRLVVGDGGVAHETGRALRRLLELRLMADEALGDVPPERAREAIEDATGLLTATEAWLLSRPPDRRASAARGAAEPRSG
jgi:uncharacterized protein (UPF0332 family)